jgi:PhzF family phenazine biosynthesis protein
LTTQSYIIFLSKKFKMKQTIIQVDAFTDRPFQGNPAAVCVLEAPQDDQWMQLVAQEMNLSETAFLLKEEQSYRLRWFTPTTEVPLCGHATLASAHVLWTEGFASTGQLIQFETKSGVLTARYQDDWIELDFPVNRSQDIPPITKLGDALGVPLKTVAYNSLGYLVEIATAEQVKQLQPNFTLLKQLPIANVIVTSRAGSDSKYDFVSRFFAPGVGIDEDPVTGSAHCCLAPYWRDRLHQDQFLAYQASPRGGIVKVNYDGGDRVLLQGQAITVMRGELL